MKEYFLYSSEWFSHARSAKTEGLHAKTFTPTVAAVSPPGQSRGGILEMTLNGMFSRSTAPRWL